MLDVISLGIATQAKNIATNLTYGPQGVYETLVALEADDPAHTGVYVVTADNKWYYYDTALEAWTAGGDFISPAGLVTEWQATPDDGHYPSEKLVDDRFNALEASRIHRYGLKMNKTTGAFTRLYDAYGKTFRRHVDTLGTLSDFSTLFPWKDMKTVKVDASRNILSVIGDANWDTTDADEMVMIPTCWSKKWEDATYEYMVVSDAPFEDYLPIGFIKPDGSVNRYRLIGAVHTSNVSTTPFSKAGVMPKYNHPLYHATTGFQIDATNKGTGWSNVDSQAFELVTRLMCVEIGSHNVKTLIGQGINGMSNSYSALNVCTVATSTANTFIMAKTRSTYFKVGMMVQIGTSYTANGLAANRYITEISEYDGTNDTITVDGAVFTTTTSSTIATWGQPLPEAQLQALKNESGYVLQFGAENLSHVCYRGIWDFWGNMWQFMSGLTRYDMQFYSCLDITKMNVNDPRSVAGWIPTGKAPDLTEGYLKTRQTYRHPLGEIGVPETTGGGAGSTTWWGAYTYYFNSSYMGIRSVLFGGYWNIGAHVSPFCWNGNYSPAYTNIGIGGRLIA